MINKFKKGYSLGKEFTKIVKRTEKELDPLIFPNDKFGKKYNHVLEEISREGFFSKAGFRTYFIFNPLDDHAKEMDQRITYLSLRKKGIIKDNYIRTINDISQKTI